MSNKIENQDPLLSTEYVDEYGQVFEVKSQMVAPRARDRKRLNADGSENLNSLPLVNPLLRQPSLKQRIEAMVRSGELAQKIREAQNMANDDDEDYEGYDRNFFDDYVPTPAEMANFNRLSAEDLPQGPQEPPQAPNEPPATPLPATPPDAA